MRKESYYLEDLVPYLDDALVKLTPDFLRKLIISSSKSEEPWKSKEFVEYIGYTFNKNVGFSTALSATCRIGRALKLSVIRKMLEFSSFTWNDLENNIISIRAGRSRGNVKINFPISSDKTLGLIVGHLLGDGSIEKYYSQPFFSNKNKELLKEFDSCIEEVFAVNGRVWIQKSNFIDRSEWIKRVKTVDDVPADTQAGLFYPSMIGIVLHTILGKFAIGKNKEITSQILNSGIEFKKGLIRAFFDDEGSVSSRGCLVRFYQDNKVLLTKLKKIIYEFNIKTNPIREYYRRNKPQYYFSITGYRNYYRFFHLIGCTSSRKNEEFQTLINRVKNSKSFKKKFALKAIDA